MRNAIDGITGVILVGGKSRRMGRDKALLPWEGRPLFERVLTLFRESFREVLLVGDREDRFAGYGVKQVPDIYPGSALGGLYTGLHHATTGYVFVAPCDMPYPSGDLVRSLCALKDGNDAVVPQTPQALEPLFALYSKRCLPPMKELLDQGNFRVYDLYPMIRTRYLADEELRQGGGSARSLINVNTPEEVALLAKPAGCRPSPLRDGM